MSTSYHFRVVAGIEMDKVVQETGHNSYIMNGETYSAGELMAELGKHNLQIHSRWGYDINGHWNGTFYNAVIGGEVLYEKEITEMPVILGEVLCKYDLDKQNETSKNIRKMFPDYENFILLFMYVYEWR